MTAIAAGHLTLRPGTTPSLACERPMVGAALMQRLAEGRRASLLPDLLASVFTLCAAAQRATARRAVLAACGQADTPTAGTRESLQLGLATAREHLQRWALDLPSAVPVNGAAPDPRWLRDAPVFAPATTERTREAAAAALPGWLEVRLFGQPPAQWLARWQHEGADWLSTWARTHDHPVCRWLRTARDEAQAFVLPCRALALPAGGEAGWRALADALAREPEFARHPTWLGQPAETGAWTRTEGPVPVRTLWDRLGARLAELAALAVSPGRLVAGALPLGDGAGLAWTEMSRGLLIHWICLENSPSDPALARATICRVIAPTEWNFHPAGALAHALAAPGTTPAQALLAAAVLDPCIAFDVDAEVPHA
jgi:hypothetical protein